MDPEVTPATMDDLIADLERQLELARHCRAQLFPPPRQMTVDELRKVVTRLIADGHLANPQQMRLQGPHLVMDIDDHVSDESIGGGRLRVVLRSPAELMMIARRLQTKED